MEKAKYQKTTDEMLKMASQVRTMDIQGCLDKISACETEGPIFDPTMYRAASKNLQIIKDLFIGLRQFQKSIPDIESVIDGHMSAKTYPHQTGL